MSDRSRVLVIVPAWREAVVIHDVVTALVGAGYAVLVVDDGSPDTTASEAAAAGAVVVRHAVNLGQGAALQTGFEHALRHGFDVVVTFDADGQHRVQDISGLLDAIARGADVALGSRALGATTGATVGRRVLLRCATWISNRISGVRLTDSHCGIRAIRSVALRRLPIHCNGMAHASELLTRARVADLNVVEVPVVVEYTAYSRGKGQGALAGIRVLWDVLVRSRLDGRPTEAA